MDIIAKFLPRRKGKFGNLMLDVEYSVLDVILKKIIKK